MANNELDGRMGRMESDISYIKRDVGELKSDIKDLRSDMKTDFRILFGAIITVTLGLASIMAKGFGWL